MRHTLLTLSDLRLGMTDLLSKRATPLAASKSGVAYTPMLTQKRDALEALPAALLARPLSVQLAEADDGHDAFGRAIWCILEANLKLPDAPADRREAARRLRAVLVPTPKELNESYATEAELARERRKQLPSWKADLQLFPVSPTETLYDWTTRFLDAGDKLDTLLAQRADKTVASRSDAAKLRTATLGILGRFRGALADEMAVDKTLPSDLDGQVFAYFDQLATMRNDTRRSNTTEDPEDDGAEGTTTSTTPTVVPGVPAASAKTATASTTKSST